MGSFALKVDIGRYSNGDALPKKNVTYRHNKECMNTNLKQSHPTKNKKYTGFDRFKYDENGVYRYHPSKLKNDIKLDLEHRIRTGQINLFVTFNPNIENISIDRLHHMVKRLEYLVKERTLRGNDRDSTNRYVAFGFIEDGSTHETRHMHLLIQVCADRMKWFERMLYKKSKVVCKSASMNVQRIDRTTATNLTQYAMKDIDYEPIDCDSFDKKELSRLYV